MANENNDKDPLDQIEEIIPTHHPNDILHGQEDHDQEDEIVVNELTHDEKVDKLEDTIKILQQQMAEGNDHIEYELKMRKKEEKALSPHRKAFKPPRKVSKTPDKREKEHKPYKTTTPEKQTKTSKPGTPEKKIRT